MTSQQQQRWCLTFYPLHGGIINLPVIFQQPGLSRGNLNGSKWEHEHYNLDLHCMYTSFYGWYYIKGELRRRKVSPAELSRAVVVWRDRADSNCHLFFLNLKNTVWPILFSDDSRLPCDLNNCVWDDDDDEKIRLQFNSDGSFTITFHDDLYSDDDGRTERVLNDNNVPRDMVGRIWKLRWCCSGE